MEEQLVRRREARDGDERRPGGGAREPPSRHTTSCAAAGRAVSPAARPHSARRAPNSVANSDCSRSARWPSRSKKSSWLMRRARPGRPSRGCWRRSARPRSVSRTPIASPGAIAHGLARRRRGFELAVDDQADRRRVGGVQQDAVRLQPLLARDRRQRQPRLDRAAREQRDAPQRQHDVDRPQRRARRRGVRRPARSTGGVARRPMRRRCRARPGGRLPNAG